MVDGTRLTSVETVHEEGSWLFTITDRYGELEEVLLVPCNAGVAAWVNRCPHQSQPFDRGMGAAVRDGGFVCPKHGSIFDACSGECDNGKAAGTRLPAVEVTIEDGEVYFTGDGSFAYAGGIDEDDEDDDGMPSSTSHIGF